MTPLSEPKNHGMLDELIALGMVAGAVVEKMLDLAKWTAESSKVINF